MNYIQRIKKFKFKKSLGQNFLVDEKIIKKIADFVKDDDIIFEIGGGSGFVTEEIVKRAKYIRTVEIDKSVIPILIENVTKNNEKCDFEVIHGDILKTDLSDFQFEGKKFKIIANIPYYITSPILAHLLGEIDDINNKNRLVTDEIYLMVQKEVANRLVATNKSKNIKDYGLLSILAQFWADVEIVLDVKKSAFYPVPKVDSSIVKFKINEKPKVPINQNLRKVIKACFSMRRKNIKNCLQFNSFNNVEEALKKANIDSKLRAENLSLDDFYRLSLEF